MEDSSQKGKRPEIRDQRSAGVVPATPSSIVPPGSANPTRGSGVGVQGPGGKMLLPKKVVTLETIKDEALGTGHWALEAEGKQENSLLSVKTLTSSVPPSIQTKEDEQGNKEIKKQSVDSQLPTTDYRLPTNMPAVSSQQPAAVSDADIAPIELPDLTSEQLAFLTSERYRESSRMIKREFGMEDEDISFLAEMEHAVLGGVIDLEQFIVALRGEFPQLNDSEKNRLIGILLAYRFEPFSDQLHPTPTEAARTQGIKVVPAPYYHVYTKPLTFRGAAHEVARMAGVDLMGQAQERLRDSIISRMKGIRTDGQIEELFMRPPEQAGLGLTEEKARIARESLVELISRARLLNEDEYAKWLNDQIHKKKSTSDLPPLATTPTTSLHADEEKEIADITSRMPIASVFEESVLSRAVDSVMKGLSWKPADDYLLRRLENTISTRLRDVRSRNEVFIKLMRDDKVGGLGLERKKAEQVAEEIEKGYQTYRGTVFDDEKQKVKKQLIEQEQKVEERKRRETEDHAKWYEEKVKSKQSSAKNGLELLKVIARGETTPIHPLDAKEEAKERELFGRLVDASKLGTMSDKTRAMKGLAAAFKEGNTTAPKKSVSPSMPPPQKMAPPPSVKVSVATAQVAEQAKGATKQKMQDVTPMKRTGAALSGPMQEIGQMTLEHFRRLSSDPKAAAKRIIDLVEVLSHESYERRIAATEAWRSSPLQKQYLELVAAAFLGKKSVTDVAIAKQATGASSPTPEEVMAIIDLNRSLSL